MKTDGLSRRMLGLLGIVVTLAAVSVCCVGAAIAGPPDLPDLENVATAEAPDPAWTTVAKVVSVYDGDTITVEIARRFEVRIVDCWAPELDGKTQRERELARRSRDSLQGMVNAAGDKITVSVPAVIRKSDGFYDPGSSTTLTRIAGKVWLAGDKWPVNERQIAAGLATREKQRDGYWQ